MATKMPKTLFTSLGSSQLYIYRSCEQFSLLQAYKVVILEKRRSHLSCLVKEKAFINAKGRGPLEKEEEI